MVHCSSVLGKDTVLDLLEKGKAAHSSVQLRKQMFHNDKQSIVTERKTEGDYYLKDLKLNFRKFYLHCYSKQRSCVPFL